MTDELREAIWKVLEGFDTGVFVRDLSNDARPDCGIKQIPYLTALGRLAQLTAYGYVKPAEAPK